nr:hypothetical protein [Dactylosporangium roseum]
MDLELRGNTHLTDTVAPSHTLQLQQRYIQARGKRLQRRTTRPPDIAFVAGELMAGHCCATQCRADPVGEVTLTETELTPTPGDQMCERLAVGMTRHGVVCD